MGRERVGREKFLEQLVTQAADAAFDKECDPLLNTGLLCRRRGSMAVDKDIMCQQRLARSYSSSRLGRRSSGQSGLCGFIARY